MDLLPDENQQEIIDATASFLDDQMPVSRLRDEDAAAVRHGEVLHAQMAELGWFGLGLSEADGGVGFTLVEEALLFREIGRRLGSTRVLASVIAAHVAAGAKDVARRDALIAGELSAAWAELQRGASLGDVLDGPLLAFDASGADLLVVACDAGAVLVDRSSLRELRSVPCIDEHTELAEVTLARVAPVARVGAEAGLGLRASALVSAMLVGVAETARDQAVAYACEREQFGKPIGIFQAIKHRCADMAVRCEVAWTQTCYAALALRDGHADAPFQASAAKVLATQAAQENAAHNVQVYGGYGFTVEYDAHLLVKRAHVLDQVCGATRSHLGRVLEAEISV